MFPDEVADLLDNDVDPDDDCGAPIPGNMNPSCMVNDTADLDDDFDGVYDHWDIDDDNDCLLYTSPSPRDGLLSRMPSSA